MVFPASPSCYSYHRHDPHFNSPGDLNFEQEGIDRICVALKQIRVHPAGEAAPDCFQKDVLLVNGELNPTIRATVGDILEVPFF